MSDEEEVYDDDFVDEEYLDIESPIEPPADLGDEDDHVPAAEFSMSSPTTSIHSKNFSTRPHKKKKMAKDPRVHFMDWQESLPYEVESLEEFDLRLEFVMKRLVQSVETKDWNVGLLQWTHRLQCLMSLRYPMRRSVRASLASLFYNIVIIPGLDPRTMSSCANQAVTLLQPCKLISQKDLTLPWRPLLKLLRQELYPRLRSTVSSSVSSNLLDLAEVAQRFFNPTEAEAMLEEILPRLEASALSHVIETQAFLCHFLPLNYPQTWLPAMFKYWETFNSHYVDEQMLHLLGRLAEYHLEGVSSASEAEHEETSNIDTAATTNGAKEGSPRAIPDADAKLWKDVGLFTKDQFAMIMTKALRFLNLPVGSSGRLAGANAIVSRNGFSDASVNQGALHMKKDANSIGSFAALITFSTFHDGPVAAQSGQNTPQGSSSNGSSSAPKGFLAGSQALDAFARYLQATEQYFHPSNWGHWTGTLNALVSEISCIFYRRWQHEKRKACRTPQARRLTEAIKREFILATRNVCMVSIFGKDPLTIAHAQKTMKRLALLEPSLIMDKFMTRAFADLEDLETWHRTQSVLVGLHSLSYLLVNKNLYPQGPTIFPQLLVHCLPAIDPTDHIKTITACVFITNALTTVRLDDLTRPELYDSNAGESDQETYPDLSSDDEELRAKAEEMVALDESIRLSTGIYEEWSTNFLDRVFLVCKSLPEEGARGRTGGAQEESVVQTLGTAVTALAESLSPHLAKRTFDHLYRYCAEEPSANAVRMIGSFVASFARVEPSYVLDRIVPLSTKGIRTEIEHGASSRRTTNSQTAEAGDMQLHWWLSTLLGAVGHSGEELLKHRDILHQTMVLLTERTLSERGYLFTARLVGRLIHSLCSLNLRNNHPLSGQDWNDPNIERNVFRTWGKLYKASEIKYEWHTPSHSEIDFALEIVRDVVDPAVTYLEKMQSVQVELRDKVWSNDFCRRLTLVRSVYEGMSGLIMESDEGGGEEASDMGGQEVAQFVEPTARIKSGFVLTDPQSPQYRYVVEFRKRVGQMLYHCGTAGRTSGAEDKQDCTKLLIRTIRTYMTEYSYSSGEYARMSQAYEHYRKIWKMSPRQEGMPSAFWSRRASYYHSLRGRLNSFYRRRTELDDKLIKEVILEYCMSTYVGVRKTAQHTWDHISSRYDGTGAITQPIAMEQVKAGVDDDRMKGALHVLDQKPISYRAAVDPRFTSAFVLKMLNAHHHPKPSLQDFVRTMLGDFTYRFVEPIALRFDLPLHEGLMQVTETIKKSLNPAVLDDADAALLEQVKAKCLERKASTADLHTQFLPQVLAIAQDESRHWSMLYHATRTLRPLVSRDFPISPELITFFAKGLLSADNALRAQHTAALAKALYYIKVRSLAASDVELVLCKGSNPLKKREKLDTPVSSDYVDDFLSSLYEESDPGDWKMRDKSSVGWLAWGEEETYYELPPRDAPAFQWEEASRPAIEALRQFVEDKEWWEKLFALLSQEKDRKAGSTENINVFKGLSQIFYGAVLDPCIPLIETYVKDTDRHKHRAASEALNGILRGSRHWPLNDQDRLWKWLSSLLEQIFRATTRESTQCWEIFLVDVFRTRDPRRTAPLRDFILQKAFEYLQVGDEVPESILVQTRAHQWLLHLLMVQGRRLLPKAKELSNAYWKILDTPYTQLRKDAIVVIREADFLFLAPSYGSTQEFLRASHSGERSESWDQLHEVYKARFAELKELLSQTLPERRPISQGTSRYDNIAMFAVGTLMSVAMEWRASPLNEVGVDFMPSLFQMLEVKDNHDLRALAGSVLTRLSALHWGPGHMPRKLVNQLFSIVEQNKDSWRTRLEALSYLQIAYFENIFYLDSTDIKAIVDMLLLALKDPRTEVREIASVSLSGIVRSSQRQLISDLTKRFTATVVSTHVPARGEAGYSEALITLHSGILGCTALVNAFPYEIPAWMPSLLVDTLCQHTDSPAPIDATIKKCAGNFKRTHQDNWTEQSKAFTSDQLAEVNAWALGRSDYFV
ncbi:unnamed protein product [Sympodiomycopsis kandeliae]